MPHASEMTKPARNNFLLYGDIGSGKTTAFRTIPGRKFLYMFDPAGLSSIKGSDDIFYEAFMPENISMSVSTLKGVKDSSAPRYEANDVYSKWENDFEKRLKANWFSDPNAEIDGVKGGFDAIGFDSITTLNDLLMDRILEINGRAGKQPEISDYGVAANALARIIRNANGQGCFVFFTGHENAAQDKLMKTVKIQLMVAGQLKQKLPILFSDIYHCHADVVNGQVKYLIDTVPTDMYPTARCSMELPPTLDITIPANSSDVTKFGLGKILREKGIWTD